MTGLLTRVRTVPVWQGLVEGSLLAGLFLFGLARLSVFVNDYAIFNGLVLSLSLGSLWASLRIPLQTGTILSRFWRDGWISFGLTMGLYLVFWLGSWFGRTDLEYGITTGGPAWILPVIIGIPGFLSLRLCWYLLDKLVALRRAHFRWELASALTMIVVLVFIVLGTVAFLLVGNIEQPPPVKEGAGPVTVFFVQILTRLFPAAALLTVGTLSIIAVGLPPFALFSYWIARRITRRIDPLAKAATQMRTGDLSARVEVEGEDEVAQLQHAFNEMACNLEQTQHALERERDKLDVLLKAHRELTAMVSHELRTPVATLRGYLETSLNGREQSPENLQRVFEVMEQETIRLQKIIDDLFALSRLETNNLALNLEPVAPEDVIQNVVQTTAPLAWQSRKVEIFTAFDPPLPMVHSDANRLKQVLHNLIQNGLRHSLPGGMIVIQAHAVQDQLEIAVQDTGQGIPQDAIEHVFERFYQAPGVEIAEGAGLGLALVKDLIEAMGGSVTVESHLGEGSRFSVWLPLITPINCDNSATIT